MRSMSAMKSEMTGKMETEAGDGGSSVRPLDLVHLSKYTFGDRGLEAELMGLFRSQAEVYISRLETATTPKDWRDAAHSLKGSARGLGAWGLGDIAEEVERHDFADEMQRHADIARVREEIDVVKDFIDEMLS